MTWRFCDWLWRLLPGGASAALIAALSGSAVLAPLEHLAYRTLFRLRGAQLWDERLVLVAIDDKSLQQLGRFPWPRQRYVELIDQLAEANPSVIAINLLWSEPSTDDQALAAALADYGRIVLAEAQGADGSRLRPVPALRAAAVATGHVQQQIDPDGTVRQLHPQVAGSLAFSLSTVQTYSLVREPVPVPPLDQPLTLNWVGPGSTLPHHSFVDVLQGNVPKQAFHDQIVLVGVTATGIDGLTTPFDYSPPASNIHFHATAISNSLQQAFLQSVSVQVFSGSLIVGGAVLSSLLFGRTLAFKIGTVVGLAIVWGILSRTLLNQNLQLPFIPPIVLGGATTVAVSVSERLRENRQLTLQIDQLWQLYRVGLEGLDGELAPPEEGASRFRREHRGIAQLSTLAYQLGWFQSFQNAVAQSLPMGVVAIDMRDRVWFRNARAEHWLAVQPGIGIKPHLIPQWISQQTWEAAVEQLKGGQIPAPHEVLVQSTWFELRWQPLLDIQPTLAAPPFSCSHQLCGFLLVVEDISPRKQGEFALSRAKQAAEQAARSKSEFLANMSHELRTPLNAILGFSNLMAENPTLSTKDQEYLAVIGRSGHHLLHLVNNVLSMAKLDTQQMEVQIDTVDLCSLLQELYEALLDRLAGKKLHLAFHCSPEIPATIWTDRDKLRQILWNLLDNAVKFTQAGQVVLRVRGEPLSSSPDQSVSLRLHFVVEDTGIGIAASEIEKVFQPFKQLPLEHHLQPGTGLGLAITQQFIHLLDGKMTVESTLGQGSTFRFTIQAQASDMAGNAAESPHTAGIDLPLAQSENWPLVQLKTVDLKAMPLSWITQLHNAALECRDSRIYELLEQIPDHHNMLFQGLKQLTDDFQFDQIIKLTASMKA